MSLSKDAPNILVVDDTPANLDLLTDLLRSEGYRIRPAINGQLALTAVETAPPDLILLDIMMPAMNGFEVCKHLKANRETSDIPIIFISALTDTQNIVKGFELGGADYVTKPFKAPEVLARVKSQLTLIQQRQQLEQRHQQDLDYFAELDDMKDQFIRSVTHDLKNPLQVIFGAVNILNYMDGTTFEANGHEYTDTIQRNAHKIQKLVTDMLELVKMKTGLKLSRQRVNVAEFFAEALLGYEMMANQQGVRMVFHSLPANATVVVDTDLISRVLDNVISNAIKFTPSGGRVDIRVKAYPYDVIFQVQDNGVGIPAEDIPHLFDPFYRVRQDKSIEGTGLGLSIVKTIIEQHHGRIEVESEVGKGSTFNIILPRKT